MGRAFLTTQDKIEKLLTRETQQRLASAGLMIIDKSDFDVVMRVYNEALKLSDTEKQKRAISVPFL